MGPVILADISVRIAFAIVHYLPALWGVRVNLAAVAGRCEAQQIQRYLQRAGGIPGDYE